MHWNQGRRKVDNLGGGGGQIFIYSCSQTVNCRVSGVPDWNYALVLGIETPCIIAVVGVQVGGGGGGIRIWEQPFSGQSLSIFWAQTMTKLK